MRNSIILCFIVLLGVLSCKHEPRLAIPMQSQDSPILGNVQKLDANISELSSSDALIVANLYNKQSLVKAAPTRQAVDVVPIKSKDGTTAIFAIDYDDGYLLVSATKQYHPILADIEHGRYQEGAANSVLIGEFVETIDAIRRGDTPPVDKSEWHRYEDLSSILSKTKVPDDYYEMLDDYWYAWDCDGRNIYFLYDQPEDMPDSMYESFCSMAEDEDNSYYGYGYMECSIITEKYHNVLTQVGPLLSTHWNQTSPWKDSIPSGHNLGCATIAAGQIMRYHAFPSSFNWSSMPDSDSSSVALCNFLAILRDRLDVNPDGGTNINRVMHGLEYFDYTCDKYQHSSSNFYSELIHNRPVYMQGLDVITGIGHAWVCDGFKTYHSWIEYELFVLLLDYNHQPLAMYSFDLRDAAEDSFTTFHMNLGYAGNNDGYYYDNNHFYVHRSDGTTRDYSIERKDLFIR